MIVVSNQDDAITVFGRNAETGSLQFLQSLSDDNGEEFAGLNGARFVAISQDGRSVYVVSSTADSITIFDRDATTGFLNLVETLSNSTLNGASSVAVAEDGRSVLVTTSFADALIVSDRDADTGRLSQRQVFQDRRVSNLRRIDGATLIDGLDSADLVAVSSDGLSMYVASTGFNDDAIVTFSRDANTGELSFVDVLNDVNGLADVRALSVSQDGRSVFAAGNDNDALLVFNRDQQTGCLNLIQSLTDENLGGSIDGLDGISSVTVSRDSNLVFVTANQDDAITVFRRDAETGELNFVQRIDNTLGQLDGAAVGTTSDDGRFFYAFSSSSEAVAIFEIDQINSAPIITSDTNVAVFENETAVLTVSAEDIDRASQTLTFSITGGSDASFFNLNSQTDTLTFAAAPNFEARSDGDADNIFEVQLTADDGNGGIATQTVRVSVEDVNEAPVITSEDNPFILENGTQVLTVTAEDEDTNGQTLEFTITGGIDADAFQINPTTGELSFVQSPNFEAITDANGDNVFEVEVTVDDGNGEQATQFIRVTIWDVNENPLITTTTNISIDENQLDVFNVVASDEDANQTITYSITGGVDASLFDLDENTGRLSFSTAPDFESPTDRNGDNVYEIEVTTDDGAGGRNSVLLSISVTDMSDTPIASSETESLVETDEDSRPESNTPLAIFTRTSVTSEDNQPTERQDFVIPNGSTNTEEIPVQTEEEDQPTNTEVDPAPTSATQEIEFDELNIENGNGEWDEFWATLGTSLRNLNESLPELSDVIPLPNDADNEVVAENERASLVANGSIERGTENTAETTSVLSTVKQLWKTFSVMFGSDSENVSEQNASQDVADQNHAA